MQKAKKVIEGYIRENKISKTEFCKRCQISLKTLNKIYIKEFDDGSKLKMPALYKIANTLGVSIGRLLDF